MHDVNVKANLLAKTLCPGRGLELRKKIHCSCAGKGFSPSIGCAGATGFNVQSRPCHGCGINTCDECRIHVLYQVFTQDPGIDMHRWWAGYLFLNPRVVAIYPPKNEDNALWNLPADQMMPLHDQGHFHVPINIIAVADPEPIARMLDINLGRHAIEPRGRTTFPYSGRPVVSDLVDIQKSRLERMCHACFERHQAQKLPPCSCTLRKRFLDRWLCIPCYMKEDESDTALVEIEDLGDDQYSITRVCECGAPLNEEKDWINICGWCKGTVAGALPMNSDDPDETVSYDGDDDDDDEDEDEDEDEDHSASDFANEPADSFCIAKNRDGSITVYVNGNRIRGHHLSHALVAAWLSTQGVKQACNCCHCKSHEHPPGHQYHHDNSETDEAMGTAASGLSEVEESDILDDHSENDQQANRRSSGE